MPGSILDANSTDELAHLSADQFDDLPFGAIELDAHDVVVAYNRAEATLARRDPKQTIGKNFFTEVAPCTNVEAFRGRLHSLAKVGGGTDVFDYNFLFPWGERKVRIRLLVTPSGARRVFVTTYTGLF
jgi:photoactive yellow protein